ncbi:MAG TPA: TAXI family TRAP transporter solute-binding subunit [Candidatus Limnocylindrales bacterium]|nr:TAXI family TRAP transporter solute-binding subunit [Candidatus Limnocylindrales bacterium]
MRRRFISVLAAIFLLTGLSHAQQLPRSIAIGSNPPGSLFYSLASGLAKVISEATPMQAQVQPYAGTSTFVPLFESGELDLGVVNAVDMGMVYQGQKLKVGGRNPFPHVPSSRLLWRGSPLRSSLIVRKDSPIKTIAGVKGKRVTGEYPAQLAVWYNVFGSLANGGLTWNDVKIVPVPAVNEGVDALVQGRADATTHAIGTAKVKEADAAVGIRYIPLDCSKQGEARIKKAVPGYYLSIVKAGSSTGIVEDTCAFTYDIYLLGHKALPDAVVRNVLQAIWVNVDKLPQFHPSFAEWTKARAVDPEVTLPYHPAAARFFKENGVWPANMDEAQKRLLAMNP